MDPTQKTNKIPQLPVEIIEKILSQVDDGITLFKASFVNSTWRAIVRRMSSQKHENIWKKICENEVNMESVFELTNQLYPAVRLEKIWTDKQIDWFTLFKMNFVWKVAGNVPCVPRTICDGIKKESEMITCVKLSGSSIVTGHNNGVIKIWNLNGIILDQIAVHESQVTDLELISFFHNENVTGFDVRHEYIISTSTDNTIQITPLHYSDKINKERVILRTHACSTMMVRVHGNDFVVVSADDHMSLWNIIPPENIYEQPKVTLIAHIQLRGNRTLAINFWANRYNTARLSVTGISDDGRMKIVTLNANDEQQSSLFWTNHVGRWPKLMSLNGDGDGEENKENTFFRTSNFVAINKAYLWRDEVYVLITEHESMCISVDGDQYKEFNTKLFLRGIPSAVLIYQNLLFLGLDTGAVVMYDFSKIEDLLLLDEKPAKLRLQMCTDRIVSMAISLTSSHLNILAASDFSMHIANLSL